VLTPRVISSPANYEQFPEHMPLCRVWEIRKNYAVSCNSRAQDGESICVWHIHMRQQHALEGKSHYWSGLEVHFPE
jgi:hypothetical protein